MRPRRMRLGYLLYGGPAKFRRTRFNEAEAHAPRIRPDYNLLFPKAISPCFRAVAFHTDLILFI